MGLMKNNIKLNDMVYSPTEIASMLKSKRSTIMKLIREGKIPSFKVGREIRVRAESLEQWMNEQEELRSVFHV